MLKSILCVGLCSILTTTAFAGKIAQNFEKLLPASEINKIVKGEPTPAVNAKYNKIIGTKMPLTIVEGVTIDSTYMKGNEIVFNITIPHKLVLKYSGEDTGLYVFENDELNAQYCKILRANPKLQIGTYIFENGKNKKKLPVSESYMPIESCSTN